MKQHITPKQAKEVSKNQFDTLFLDKLVPRDDWANYHHKKMDIGKMIEVLDEVTISRDSSANTWTIPLFGQMDQYSGKELVDTLWHAIKDELAEQEPDADA